MSAAAAGETTPLIRRYSFFCLSWNNNLCLGVSPGTSEATAGLSIQLKPYLRNHFKGTEIKKMRWDLIAAEEATNTTHNQGYMRLEVEGSEQYLCVDSQNTNNNDVLLYPCTDDLSTWVFDLDKGVLRLGKDPKRCATVSKCVQRVDKARSCKGDVEDVETQVKNFVEGSVIHAKPCFDSAPTFAPSLPAQIFTRELDCVAGCSPDLLVNGKCDEICNNVECASDKGECIDSLAPTLAPTSAITDPPTFNSDIENEDPIGGATTVDAPSYWWLVFIFLLFCCMATGAMFLRRRKRRAFSSRIDEDGPLNGDHQILVSSDDDDNSEARFKTASAVALNQLRYHSRVANSSSSSASHIKSETVKRRPETTSNDRPHSFQEVSV